MDPLVHLFVQVLVLLVKAAIGCIRLAGRLLVWLTIRVLVPASAWSSNLLLGAIARTAHRSSTATTQTPRGARPYGGAGPVPLSARGLGERVRPSVDDPGPDDIETTTLGPYFVEPWPDDDDGF